jgi:hypothetical protein
MFEIIFAIAFKVAKTTIIADFIVEAQSSLRVAVGGRLETN